MKIKLDAGAYMPERAHLTDAGLDIKSMYNLTIPRRGFMVCPTGVHVQLPPGTYGDVRSKSGLLSAQNLFVTGTIDEGYTGEVKVIMFNLSGKDQYISAGQKIAQLVVVKCIRDEIEIVDKIDGGPRGNNGFGSTGK